MVRSSEAVLQVACSRWDDGDIMCRSGCADPPNVDRTLKDECLSLPISNYCSSQHEEHCRAQQQNSHQEMLTLVGPA